MNCVLIIHDVVDIVIWKSIFDEAANLRKSAGEIRYQVFEDSSTPNKVVHFSEWTSLEQAKVFFESKDLVEIRRKVGVQLPVFMYLRLVEEGIL